MRSPAFQFYPSNYLGSRAVRLMDAEQRGWYTQLLFESWESEPQATLPNDDALLRVLAGVNTCSTDVEQRWGFVKAQFKQKGKLLYNSRLLEEFAKQDENREKKRRAGEASGEARRTKREAVKAQHLSRNGHKAGTGNTRSTPVPVRSDSAQTEYEQNRTLRSPTQSPDSISEEKTASRASLARDVFAFWQVHLNHPAAILDGKRESAILGRLKDGYTADQLKDAIRGCKLSDFHMGLEHGKPAVHDGITLICKDAEHVDMFIAKTRNGTGTAPVQTIRERMGIQR